VAILPAAPNSSSSAPSVFVPRQGELCAERGQVLGRVGRDNLTVSLNGYALEDIALTEVGRIFPSLPKVGSSSPAAEASRGNTSAMAVMTRVIRFEPAFIGPLCNRF
jgi:hypothetical protein